MVRRGRRRRKKGRKEVRYGGNGWVRVEKGRKVT